MYQGSKFSSVLHYSLVPVQKERRYERLYGFACSTNSLYYGMLMKNMDEYSDFFLFNFKIVLWMDLEWMNI